jgi:hypothetical protein
MVRLPSAEQARLCAYLVEAGALLRDGPAADEQLAHLRPMYKPYVAALSQLLLMELPPWLPVPGAIDDWQSSPTE